MKKQCHRRDHYKNGTSPSLSRSRMFLALCCAAVRDRPPKKPVDLPPKENGGSFRPADIVGEQCRGQGENLSLVTPLLCRFFHLSIWYLSPYRDIYLSAKR
ncbi:hypothetical protein ABFX02_13G051800 [Erythranthe guttata]